MSKIKNEAKIKNPLIVAIREQLEHRALWMYLLCDEAKKKGLDSKEYAPDAIKRCGLYQGANLRKIAGVIQGKCHDGRCESGQCRQIEQQTRSIEYYNQLEHQGRSSNNPNQTPAQHLQGGKSAH